MLQPNTALIMTEAYIRFLVSTTQHWQKEATMAADAESAGSAEAADSLKRRTEYHHLYRGQGNGRQQGPCLVGVWKNFDEREMMF